MTLKIVLPPNTYIRQSLASKSTAQVDQQLVVDLDDEPILLEVGNKCVKQFVCWCCVHPKIVF